ncbi:MAG: hypothetical protein QOH72_407 [Solirubrobacteraceae bacterium]|jgi:hypothetical protein|nr:hypothetical protein [Solirubrobacteraceae bacterium]
MSELERRLAMLRDEVAWPPTPDLASAVAARVASEPRRAAPARLWPALRPATLALAAVVVALVIAGTLAAAPGVRARIADWLGIGAVRVERVERLPDVGPATDLGLGPRTTLAAARRTARVPVPTIGALGAPDAVYVERPGPAGASLVYLARPGLPAATHGIGALLTMLPGGDIALVKKLLGAGTSVTSVDVDGALGVYISGAPHVVTPPNRLAGNTLIWVRGDTTYRLETALGRAAALRLARTVR